MDVKIYYYIMTKQSQVKLCLAGEFFFEYYALTANCCDYGIVISSVVFVFKAVW